jgi:hypothetical protein
MSRKSNKEILKKYLIKENIKYKTINIDNEEIIILDISILTNEQKNNLYKDIE